MAFASLAQWGWMHVDILWEGTPTVLGMEHGCGSWSALCLWGN